MLLLKIESDYTVQSSGQLSTNVWILSESLNIETETRKENTMGKDILQELTAVLPAQML